MLTTRTQPLPRMLLALALLITTLLAVLPSLPAAAATNPVPTRLRAASTTSTSITLAWDAVPGAPKYRIRQSTSSSMSNSDYFRYTSNTAVLTGLEANTSYYFAVRTITTGGDNLSAYSASIKVTTPAKTSTTAPAITPPVTTQTTATSPQPLRVASYNIKCSNCGGGLTWDQRRDSVVANIKAQNLDVLGAQEAGQGWLKDSNNKSIDLSQFEDLRNRLGGSWTLTNTARNNCVKSSTPFNCVYKDQGASQDAHILYDNSRVELLAQWSKKLPFVSTDDNDRYVAWAQLRQRSTGIRFMFATTHLEPEKDPSGSGQLRYHYLRQNQAQVAIDTVKAHNPENLPVMFVGDFNSSRFYHDYAPTNAPYDVMVRSGLVDPLGGAFGTTKTAPGATAEKRINTWLNSFNDFVPQAKGNHDWKNGSYIDYIFVSSSIRVGEWETVAKLDSSDRFIGTIPSDHNMIRTTVYLPLR